MLKEFIKILTEFKDLKKEQMKQAMNIIMEGKASEIQIASFLTALAMKGESIDEIVAAAEVMREKAEKIDCSFEIILDTCGTGGDRSHTFNISTATAIVAAAAGVKVAKHGNRGVTSLSGSADILRALGVNIELTPDKIKNCLKKAGIAFLFAPGCHKAMKYAMPVRKELGIRTIFNMLGPLINPVKNTHHLMGVFNEALTEKIANVLKKMGLKHAAVVCGKGNVDEIILWGPTKISELKNGKIKTYKISPTDFKIKKSPKEAVKGGTPEENATVLKEIFEGKRKDAYYDIIVLNSGFALYIADLVNNVKSGIEKAKELIENGMALKKLNELIECSNN